MDAETGFFNSLRMIRENSNLPFLFAGAGVVLLLLTETHLLSLERGTNGDRIAVLMLFFFLFALTLFLLWRSGFVPNPHELMFFSLPVALAFFFRALCMDHVTSDYTLFLAKWVELFRNNGGLKALSMPIGDYNVPYLYFLALFSYFRLPDLYLIKLLSILFDILLALWTMKLTGVLTTGRARPLAAFCITLLLPTVILNGAYWGQCDSIYGAFTVLALYLALSGRPISSVAAIAVSFAFKLQAIFLMPIYFVLLYTRRVKIRHLLVFPGMYLWIALPAILFGKPFLDTVTIYFRQIKSYNNRLTLNAPSVFTFAARNADVEFYGKIGIIAAFLLVICIFGYLFFRRAQTDKRALFVASFLFVVGIPLLLPHMHERYFFLADVLSLVLACVIPKRFFIPIFVSIASYGGYHAYLNLRYAFDMRYGTLLLIAVTLILLFDLWRQTMPKHNMR